MDKDSEDKAEDYGGNIRETLFELLGDSRVEIAKVKNRERGDTEAM